MPKVKLPALPRWASVAKSSGTAPKPPEFALRATSRSPLAIRPRACARGILAKASDLKCLELRGTADRLADLQPGLPREPGWSVRQGAPGAASCSSAFRKAPRTFPRHQAREAGLPPYTINTATVQPCRIDRPGSSRLPREGRTTITLGRVQGIRCKAQGEGARRWERDPLLTSDPCVLNEFR
jgi:hypothetical protein